MSNKIKKILIIGAGEAGIYVSREIKTSPEADIKIVGFIDDDPKKSGKKVEGIKVLGGIHQIENIVHDMHVDESIIALPSVYGDVIESYVKTLSRLKVPFRIVPRVREIIEGKVHLSSLRRVEVQDLLGRPVVKSDIGNLQKFFSKKTVLITGAAGSIGSELSEQIAAYKPKKLILFDCWENGIFELKQKFKEIGFVKNINYFIGNIQDVKRLEFVFSISKPDYVFHAAAYKHVPLMEENPIEAIKNNIFGTYNVAKTSIKFKVDKFVLVSTDKAADPKNIMGMTKSFAEKIVRSLKTNTKFITVRFGNVLDSNGSVVPIFRRQIEKGGPVTVTDKRMTRYFMTIPEAAQLIIKSAFLGKGKELFVLDMGKPVSILKLAHDMIRLSGYEPERDIKIKFTGIRPGEKLTEKLFTKMEKLDSTNDKKIFVSSNGGYFLDLKFKISEINKLIKINQNYSVGKQLEKLLYEK